MVEAGMHRRYVLARDLPVFREHGLPNVLYFSDDSPQALGMRIAELAKIGQKPAPAAILPTWCDCVDGLLEALGIRHVCIADEPAEHLLRKAS